MQHLVFVLLAVFILSSEAPGAGPYGKGRDQQWDRKFEKAEKSLLQPGSKAGKTGQPGKIGSLLEQADALAREGSTKEQLDKAVSLAKQALQLAQEKDVPTGIARANLILGLICLWRTEFDKALEYNKRAIAPAKRAGNCKALAAATKNIGNVYRAWGQYEKATESFAEAIRIAEGCSDHTIVAWTTLNLGQVHNFQGRYREALKCLEKGLSIASEIGNPEIEGYIRTEIGVAYTRTGRFSTAAAYLESALTIGDQARKPRVQQEALAELGGLYFLWGKYREAADYFQKTLDRARRYGEKRRETSALFSQGEVYAKWGRYSDALGCFQSALAMAKSTGIVLQEMRILSDMGMVYSSRGQYHRAVEYFEQALELNRTLGNAHGEGNILNNLGRVYQTWGQYEQALAHFQQSLEILRKLGVPTRAVTASIGNLYLDMGEVSKAEPFIKDAGLEAPLGRLSLVRNDYLSAKNHYESLMKFAERNRNADNLFTAYTGLGMACEGMDDLSAAADYYRKAVEHSEYLRSSLNPAERETFFDVKIEGFYRTAPYEGLARVLMKMNRPLEAFKQSEYTRARIFAEAISRSGEHSGREVPPDVREADSSLANQLASLNKNLQRAYEEQNEEIIASLEPQVKEAKERLDAHIHLLRERFPLFAATRYPQPMDLGQTALESDEWVLEYHVTDPGLIIYCTHGKNLIKNLYNPVQRKEVDDLVRKFREPLEIKSGDDFADKLESFDFAAGKRLFGLLLADILPSLPKESHVTIVPDDSLGVLPFEMLPLNATGRIATDKEIPYVSGAEFFGDRNSISYYQSITALTLARTYGKQRNPGRKLLVFADPVFQAQDARYQERQTATRVAQTASDLYQDLMSVMGDDSGDRAGIPRLPLTSKLADHLAKMYGGRAECYTGLQASKERFLKRVGPDSMDYDKIVFATHGYFGKDLPGIKEPVLVLSLVPPGTDGFLRMSEVTSLKMNSDLVVLTACQSGLGKKISGEGTMGMGRAFQYSGAKCVLMSLWSVEQNASVTLVDSLFEHIKEGKNRLEALKLARKEIRDQGYDHPFFWAPFILVGEVR